MRCQSMKTRNRCPNAFSRHNDLHIERRPAMYYTLWVWFDSTQKRTAGRLMLTTSTTTATPTAITHST